MGAQIEEVRRSHNPNRNLTLAHAVEVQVGGGQAKYLLCLTAELRLSLPHCVPSRLFEQLGFLYHSRRPTADSSWWEGSGRTRGRDTHMHLLRPISETIVSTSHEMKSPGG
ncbi:unnamed protein product [Pleuronectes platessa]|uniref:Uncharacterized protein n=1 Tax=Pleuronectes platessa TaxID=8262 RepID=A0A9N7Y6E9_PLEPL|nr:unnamed protein product [Pleuronectes platessa]